MAKIRGLRMRTTTRSVVVVVLALFATVLLCLTSTIRAAVMLAANALIVPGTSTMDPSKVTGFMPNAVNYYIMPNAPSCSVTCTPVPIKYPASLWPLTGLTSAKWNVSVASGVSSVNSEVINQLAMDPTGPIVVFGFSQGAAVDSQEKSNLAGVTNKGQFSFVLLGNPERPNGGVFERLALLGTVPILDVTFGLPTPTNTGIATTDIAYQYDGVADFPEYPIDVLADLNALEGILNVHQVELAPNSKQMKPLPYGYTQDTLIAAEANPANRQVFGDTTYITIPATNLPLLDPIEKLASATGTSLLVTPIIDLIQPALQVLIEIGYNRTNYGQPSPFGLIPLINPITLATQLVGAIGAGVQNALSNLGNPTPVPLPPYHPADPSTPTPATVTPAIAASVPTGSPTAATLLKSITNVVPATGNTASLPTISQTVTTPKKPNTNAAAPIGNGGLPKLTETVARKPATNRDPLRSDKHQLTPSGSSTTH